MNTKIEPKTTTRTYQHWSRRQFIVAGSMLAASLAGCGKKSSDLKRSLEDTEVAEISAGYLPMVSSLTFFVAEEKGYFAKQKLRVKPRPLPTSNAIAEDLIRGNIDVAIELAIVPLLVATDDKPRFKIFSTSIITEENGFDGVIVNGESPIRELKDLSGKKVMTFPGTTAERTFASVFHGLFPDVPPPTFVQRAPNQHLQSLLNGECDALHAYEPFLSEGVVERGCRKIFGSLYGRQLSPSPIGVGAVNSRWLSEKPDIASRFFSAIDEAVAFIEQDLDQAREILARWTDKKMQVASKMNIMRMSTTGKLDRASLEKYSAILMEMKEITTPIPVAEICIPEQK